MNTTTFDDNVVATDHSASTRRYRFTQSQFGGVFIAVALLTVVIGRFARYAGGWDWIEDYTAELIECGIWCVLMVPLVFVAFQTEMTRTTRCWFYALIVFQTSDVVLDLTRKTKAFSEIPLLGGAFRIYDGHNGSLNEIAIAVLGAGSAICLFYVWFRAMSEADLVRESLAKETKRLDAEIRERERVETRIQELTVGIQHSARLNMIGEIVAGVAHEIHQPLGAITNYANGCKIRMRDGTLQPHDANRALDRIADTAMHAGKIVDRIRSFAQKKSPDVLPTDANIAIRNAVELAEFAISKRNIELDLDLANNLPEVPIDSVEVTQVVLNLLLNGAEAIEDSEAPRRTISIKSRNDSGHGVLISVRDSGLGIAPEADERIYEQFFSTKEDGLGMGLAICRAIVDRYEGRLWHEPNDSEGTVFHFSIPLEQSDPKLKLLAQEKVA